MWINISKEDRVVIAGHPLLQNLAKRLSRMEAQRIGALCSDEIGRARSYYCAPSGQCIEIDDSCAVSRCEDGTWVQAWVWVTKRNKLS